MHESEISFCTGSKVEIIKFCSKRHLKYGRPVFILNLWQFQSYVHNYIRLKKSNPRMNEYVYTYAFVFQATECHVFQIVSKFPD